MPIVSVILLLIVGLIIASAVQASSANAARIIPEELDLNSVRDAVMEKLGWSRGRAEAARIEYLRFLTLLQKRPGFMLVPWSNVDGQDDLDQFWHQHILDTAKYATDCDRLFGKMIHHNPHLVLGSGQETDARAKTQRLYARTFGSGPYGTEADAVILASCGACATADVGSSSDGGHGHGGDGHSCGGHGCGHGCGGHGCGSGCGGH